MQEGVQAKLEFTVNEMDTAIRLGSGTLDVLATPRLVAMMEATACAALSGQMQEGDTSVGGRIDIEHLAASAIGSRVATTAEITRLEGRKIHFHIEATCNGVLIGRAEHDRVVVNAEKFMGKIAKIQ